MIHLHQEFTKSGKGEGFVGGGVSSRLNFSLRPGDFKQAQADFRPADIASQNHATIKLGIPKYSSPIFQR